MRWRDLPLFSDCPGERPSATTAPGSTWVELPSYLVHGLVSSPSGGSRARNAGLPDRTASIRFANQHELFECQLLRSEPLSRSISINWLPSPASRSRQAHRRLYRAGTRSMGPMDSEQTLDD